MKIALFTLTKNRCEYTKEMLSALNQKTMLEFDHFFIDQNSTDDTLKLLGQFPHGRGKRYVYPLSKNVGINRAVNFAVERMRGKYDIIIKYDNDMEALTDYWLFECVSVMGQKMLLSPYITGLIENRGGVPRIRKINETLSQTFALGGMVMIGLKRAWVEDSGGWTTPVALHAGGDMDFCRKLSEEGYVFAYKENVVIRHMDTSIGQKEKYPLYFKLRKYEKEAIL